MFDMQKIGRKIASLRKAANMTQPELADRLSISFQAVSNWERGMSMPDISNLPELAEIFDVSIDELLGRESKFIRAVAEAGVEEYFEKEETVSHEELEDALPLLKPNQVESVMEKVNPLNLPNVSAFLPFLDEEAVRELAEETLKQGGSIGTFLPFMDSGDAAHFAGIAFERGESMGMYLPFLEGENMKRFALAELEKGNSVSQYLPFLDEDDVAELAKAELAKGNSVSSYLPHLDEDDVAELAKIELAKGNSISTYLPHLDEDDVAELAYAVLEKGGNISAYLPFLDGDVVKDLAIRAFKNKK